jgi:hypothetical protein
VGFEVTPAAGQRCEEYEWAEALNSDLGHIYEPSATTSPFSPGAEYGWPTTMNRAHMRDAQ